MLVHKGMDRASPIQLFYQLFQISLYQVNQNIQVINPCIEVFQISQQHSFSVSLTFMPYIYGTDLFCPSHPPSEWLKIIFLRWLTINFMNRFCSRKFTCLLIRQRRSFLVAKQLNTHICVSVCLSVCVCVFFKVWCIPYAGRSLLCKAARREIYDMK